MQKGGSTFYYGPVEQVIAVSNTINQLILAQVMDYFQQKGFLCPELGNPADFFMDVIAGELSPNFPAPGASIEADSGLTSPETVEVQPDIVIKEPLPSGTATHDPVDDHDQRTGFFALYGLYLWRCFLQQYRFLSGLWLELILQVICSVGLNYSSVDDENYLPPMPTEFVPTCPSIISARCFSDSCKSLIIHFISVSKVLLQPICLPLLHSFLP